MATLTAEELHQEGVRYYHGDGVKADEKKAIECFEKAIKLGNLPESKRSLGHILMGNISRHWAAQTNEQKRGIALLEEAAADGDTIAKQWYVNQYINEGVGALLLKLKFGKSYNYTEAKRKASLARKYKKELGI